MTLGDRFESALGYALRAHAGQTRKGTAIPYVQHLLGTASIALFHGADEDEAIAALLHDAAEDQGGRERLGDIAARFGGRVAAIVEECSDTLETPKPPWHARKQGKIRHLATDASPAALLVSAADKLDNARAVLADLRAVGPAVWQRFRAGQADQLGYYRGLVEAFRARRPDLAARGAAGLVEELDRVVAEIARLSAGA